MSKVGSKIFSLAGLAMLGAFVITASSCSSSRETQSTQKIWREVKASGNPVATPKRSLAYALPISPETLSNKGL